MRTRRLVGLALAVMSWGCAPSGGAPRPTVPPLPAAPAAGPAGCSAVEKAIDVWTILQKAYDDLLPTAIAKGWAPSEYHAAAAQRANSQIPSGAVDPNVPAISTDPCSCLTTHLDEVCASYAARGLPSILCDASRAHEDVHVRLCQDNKALPPGDPNKYVCDAAGKARMSPRKLDRTEHEAYDATLGILGDWFQASKCPRTPPPLPARHPIAACTLLDGAEAAGALGRSLTGDSPKAERPGLYSVCTYFGEPQLGRYKVDVVSVAVSVRQGPIDRAGFAKDIAAHAASVGPATALDGIGDEAYAIGPVGDPGYASVLVLRGDVEFGVTVYFQHGDAPTAPLETAKALAASIAGRLAAPALNAALIAPGHPPAPATRWPASPSGACASPCGTRGTSTGRR